jgi:hypothetical protein
MCNIDRVRKEVERFVERDDLFTSVDIANAIKRGNQDDTPEWIRNSEVAAYLRGNALQVALQSGKNYEMTPVPVTLASGAVTSANVYHPLGTDALDYSNTAEKAITPDEFAIIEASWTGAPATPKAIPPAAVLPPTVVPKDSGTQPVSPSTGKPDAYTQFRFPTTS